MIKDKAIQNQKVFVRLDKVLELQNEINRLSNRVNNSTETVNVVRGLKRAAELLELPIRTN